MVNMDEVRADLSQMESLISQASRPNVRSLLVNEQTRLLALINQDETEVPKTEKKKIVSDSINKQIPSVKITNYGWDQSDKFIKLYITVNGVHDAPSDNIHCQFTSDSFDLAATSGGKRFEFACKNLLQEIIPDQSVYKQKKDMILVMCKKKTEAKNWEYLTKTEKMIKDQSKPKFDVKDESADPQESLMGMMKQMYDEGDDEMKRTIRKAWHEGQKNKTGGGDFGMGDM